MAVAERSSEIGDEISREIIKAKEAVVKEGVRGITKADVRRAFTELGYTVLFKTNAYNERLCTMRVETESGETVVSAIGTFSAAMITEHREAFRLYTSLQGVVLKDSLQKIV